MRFLLLLLFPSVVLALDKPIIEARGETLGEFAVVFRADLIKADTPRALGESFARFLTEQRRVAHRFQLLAAAAHTELLQDYYAPALVATQARIYDTTIPATSPYSCDVIGEDKGVVKLVMYRKDGENLKLFAMRLRCAKKGGRWVIRDILDRTDTGWDKRGLGVPPKLPEVTIPAAGRANRSSSEKTVRSLRTAVLRLRAQRRRAQLAQHRHYFAILEAFYGEAKAKKARAGQTALPESTPVQAEVREPIPLRGGAMRVEVLIIEEVPGSDGQRSAIGQVAFDLKEVSGGWRIVNEYTRPKSDGPLVPAEDKLGLIFLLG